jgi:hypothetical protein
VKGSSSNAAKKETCQEDVIAKLPILLAIFLTGIFVGNGTSSRGIMLRIRPET